MTSSVETLDHSIKCIFGLTLKDEQNGLLLMKEFCNEKTDLINLEILEQILFERLLFSSNDIKSYLSGPTENEGHTIQTECWTYLIECYNRVNSRTTLEDRRTISDLIIRNMCTALKQPDLYENQHLHNQIIDVFKTEQYSTELQIQLFQQIVNEFERTEDEAEVNDLLLLSFQPLLKEVEKTFTTSSLVYLPMRHFDLLFVFTSIDRLIEVLIRFNELEPPKKVVTPSSTRGEATNNVATPSSTQGNLNSSTTPSNNPTTIPPVLNNTSSSSESTPSNLSTPPSNVVSPSSPSVVDASSNLLNTSSNVASSSNSSNNVSNMSMFHNLINNIVNSPARRSYVPVQVPVAQDSNVPAQVPVLGCLYEKTLFGSILNISCLPKHAKLNKPRETIIEYFSRPLEYTPSGLQTAEGNVWIGLDTLVNLVHKLFHQILKTKNIKIRNKFLSWIGKCLEANEKRGKLWTVMNNTDIRFELMSISDAMAFNLTAVLLKLAKPIISSEEKYLKIDPTYCSCEENSEEMGIHLKRLNKETCLLPLDENEVRLKPVKPLTFITECYWITQKSIDLSFRVMVDKLTRINEDVGRLQSALMEAVQNNMANASNNPMFKHLKESLELQTAMFMAYRTVLLHPSTLKLLSQFQLSTSNWLIQILLDVDHTSLPRESHAPLRKNPVSFPLPDKITPMLKCIPEFIIYNFWSLLYLIKNNKIYFLEEMGTDLLNPLLTFILAFMGSNSRIKNPHLRAKLAESLECLLPKVDGPESQINQNILGNTHRQRLFLEHPHRHYIVKSILDIFVGIEMTGESVQFEQKFNYRHPMYNIMKFLWGIPEHKDNFIKLAVYAESHMESDQPPLFLRFINLLMNDAVFLLDEALSNMAQIRTLQSDRENGVWARLPPREQEQTQAHLTHTGMIARFDNILGNETINTLEYLSSEIKSIFCHSTMVDRITAMLNYFLYHLVGPKKKNFKVKDMQEFKFSPANVVLNICKMYVHLGNDDNFCAAVSRDGRSYSPQLFVLAEGVLVRIGGGYLIEDLRVVAERVSKLGAQQKSDEELLSEAPEEYLDPIMNTLMKEPVILPSSKQTVDKSTIARHLLSDQSDPFNRSPLTMDQVIPNTKLQLEIEQWIADVRLKSAATIAESNKIDTTESNTDITESNTDITESNTADTTESNTDITE